VANEQAIVRALLARHGRTYADELGVDLAKNTPSVLFRWLTASILLSARIGAGLAMRGAKALARAGWTTADKMAAATWEERVRVLNESGYARYDESTSRMLGDTSALLLDRYQGDLRKLRAAAERNPAAERRLLKECKGLGDTGVDIFFREVQVAWDELYPFVGRRDLEVARKLGLPGDPEQLAKLVGRQDFVALCAALVRTGLAKNLDTIRQEARG
jgi:hypothetical protein